MRARWSRPGGWTTTRCGRTVPWGIGRRRNLRRPRAVEKTVASPPWIPLRGTHFPTDTTTAELFRLLQLNPNPWQLHYDGTKNGGQVMASETSPIVAGLLVHRLAISPKHLSFSVRDLAPAIRQFAKLSRDSDLTRFCTYLMLTELNLIPKKPQPAGALVLRHLRLPVIAGKQSLLSAFFQDLFAVGINLHCERFLGRPAHIEQ